VADIRYVCMSDLHFGAANSLLSHVPTGGVAVDPTSASPCLTAFVDCLKELVDTNEDKTRRPDLVLNGDILEFALASDNLAAMTFERFIDLAFVQHELFDRVILLPGNHDHHLWESAREKQYAAHIQQLSGNQLPAPWHATNLSEEGTDVPVESELVVALFARRKVNVPVQVRYPTYGVFSPDGSRAAVFHHGHFIEAIYLLMSEVQRLVFPTQPLGEDIWDWEASNFAWIDFFWSTLGRSGAVGTDVGMIYDLLQSPEARDLMAGKLSRAVTTRMNPVIRGLLSAVIRHEIKTTINGAKQLERANAAAPTLSARGEAGLEKLLEGPLARQISQANSDSLPATTTFVFGHTHKPYQRQYAYPSYPGGVAVYNTGGWVVDEPHPVTAQGAAVVVLDENLNAATVRLYQQTVGDAPPRPVTVDTVQADGNDLYARLVDSIAPTGDPWAALTAAAAAEVPARIRVLETMIADGIVELQATP
jgi:hypothetical protein